ncbi:MAG: hypothetical protein AAB527_03505, partial [Patescibacteria group bacterium]
MTTGQSKKIISIFLMIATILLSLPLNNTYAQEDFFGLGDTTINTGGATGGLTGFLTSLSVPTKDVGLNPKEFSLDL